MTFRKLKNNINYFKVYFGIFAAITCFAVIVGYIFIKAVGEFNFNFIISTKEDEGLLPAIINTLLIIFLTLLISLPIGIGSAVYLNEYAKKGSKLVKIIRITTQSLSGIPSIVYGLFGFLCFVIMLGWSWSILAGVFTLSIMVLPVIMQSVEEALKSVPDSFREGSYALGTGKLRTIYKIILPSAMPGIVVAIILSIGRIVSESAALILTAGTVMKIASSLFSSGGTLSVFMYKMTNEGTSFSKAYMAAIILMLIVLLLNLSAGKIAQKLKKS